MRTLLTVELAVAVLLTLAFLLRFGRPWRALDTGMAWHIATFSVVIGFEWLSLLLILLGVPVPPWVFAWLFAAGDAVIAWRLALLIKARGGR